jgi:hypothetical protein
MRNFCRAVILASATDFLSCSEVTRPAPTRKFYVLESVDGHPVPAVVYSAPIETYTALDGALLLQTSDSAKEIFHARDSLTGYGTSVGTDTIRGSYRIDGDSIEVGFFGRCRDICAPNRIGRYDDSTITLTYAFFPPSGPVYAYRLVADSSQ